MHIIEDYGKGGCEQGPDAKLNFAAGTRKHEQY